MCRESEHKFKKIEKSYLLQDKDDIIMVSLNFGFSRDW